MRDKWVFSFFQYWYQDLKAFFQRNGKAFWQEMIETQELVVILAKMAVLKKVTTEEKKAVIQQFKDLGKMGLVFSIFIAPGGSVLLPLLAKFLPWDLLPATFKKEVKKEVHVGEDFFIKSEADIIKEIEEEHRIHLKGRKVHWLIEDFEDIKKTVVSPEGVKSLVTRYMDSNHHHFLRLMKALGYPISRWKKAIREFRWDKTYSVIQELEGSLFKKSFEKEAYSILDQLEDLVKQPIPVEIVLMVSLGLFKRVAVWDRDKIALYFGLDSILYRASYPRLLFTITLSQYIGRWLRYSLMMKESYFHMDWNEAMRNYNSIPYRDRFLNSGISLAFSEEICSGAKDHELLQVGKGDLQKIKKYLPEDIPDIQKKSHQDPVAVIDRYASLLISRKLLKRYSYNELLHLPSDYYFKHLNDL